jgi:hypothetical protein
MKIIVNSLLPVTQEFEVSDEFIPLTDRNEFDSDKIFSLAIQFGAYVEDFVFPKVKGDIFECITDEKGNVLITGE